MRREIVARKRRTYSPNCKQSCRWCASRQSLTSTESPSYESPLHSVAREMLFDTVQNTSFDLSLMHFVFPARSLSHQSASNDTVLISEDVITDLVHGATFLVDFDGTISYVTPNISHFIGLTQVCSAPYRNTFTYIPSDRSRRQTIARFRASGRLSRRCATKC